MSDYWGGWTTAITGHLPDGTQYDNCGEIPLSRFRPTAGLVRARFVKFAALSHYGTSGAGLHYFNVVQYDKREGNFGS